MKQTNFHTHTSRCHHAFGNDEEFVRLPFKMVLKYWAFQIMRVGNMTLILWRICV